MKKNQTQKVYDYLKNKIVTKMIYPGTRIIEKEIVDELGISRTPVRSALMKLAYEGMVEIESNRGAKVAVPSATDFMQVYEARKAIEIEAFKLAVNRRDEESVARLKNNLDKQMKMEDTFNMIEYSYLNNEFHTIIIQQSRNEYLAKLLIELYGKLSTYLLFWDNSSTNADSLENHKNLYEAFRDKDLDKGVKALINDIELSKNSVSSSKTL